MKETRGRQAATLFEALGGAEGELRLARAWHERVMAHEIVAHAFNHGFHPLHAERLAAYWGEVWGSPPTYSAQYGSESAVVRIHSGNGAHAEMDRRAIDCCDQALNDVGLVDPLLRRVLHMSVNVSVFSERARSAANEVFRPIVSRPQRNGDCRLPTLD